MLGGMVVSTPWEHAQACGSGRAMARSLWFPWAAREAGAIQQVQAHRCCGIMAVCLAGYVTPFLG